MSGTELVAKIREMNTEMPIMLMSASEPTVLNISQSLRITKFCHKPITPSQLKQAVCDYLTISSK